MDQLIMPMELTGISSGAGLAFGANNALTAADAPENGAVFGDILGRLMGGGQGCVQPAAAENPAPKEELTLAQALGAALKGADLSGIQEAFPREMKITDQGAQAFLKTAEAFASGDVSEDDIKALWEKVSPEEKAVFTELLSFVTDSQQLPYNAAAEIPADSGDDGYAAGDLFAAAVKVISAAAYSDTEKAEEKNPVASSEKADNSGKLPVYAPSKPVKKAKTEPVSRDMRDMLPAAGFILSDIGARFGSEKIAYQPLFTETDTVTEVPDAATESDAPVYTAAVIPGDTETEVSVSTAVSAELPENLTVSADSDGKDVAPETIVYGETENAPEEAYSEEMPEEMKFSGEESLFYGSYGAADEAYIPEKPENSDAGCDKPETVKKPLSERDVYTFGAKTVSVYRAAEIPAVQTFVYGETVISDNGKKAPVTDTVDAFGANAPEKADISADRVMKFSEDMQNVLEKMQDADRDMPVRFCETLVRELKASISESNGKSAEHEVPVRFEDARTALMARVNKPFEESREVVPTVMTPKKTSFGETGEENVRETSTDSPEKAETAVSEEKTAGIPAAGVQSPVPKEIAENTAQGRTYEDTSISEQIIERIDLYKVLPGFGEGVSQREITMKLSPEELGELEIKIKRSGNAVEISFTAEKPEAARLIGDSAKQLADAVASRGADLKEISVSQRIVTNESDGSLAGGYGENGAYGETDHRGSENGQRFVFKGDGNDEPESEGFTEQNFIREAKLWVSA